MALCDASAFYFNNLITFFLTPFDAKRGKTARGLRAVQPSEEGAARDCELALWTPGAIFVGARFNVSEGQP